MTDEERSQALLYYLVLPILVIAAFVWFVNVRAKNRKRVEEAARLANAPPELNLELVARQDGAYLEGTVINVSSRRLENAQVRIICLTKEKEGSEQPAPVDIGPLAAGESSRYDKLLPFGCGIFAPYRLELASYKLKD